MNDEPYVPLVDDRLMDRRGSSPSSSSLLTVKSTTTGSFCLPLLIDGAADVGIEDNRDAGCEEGVGWNECGVVALLGSLLMRLGCMSPISMISSSSSSGVSPSSESFPGAGLLDGTEEEDEDRLTTAFPSFTVPSGSIVTWSVDFGNRRRMSCTYWSTAKASKEKTLLHVGHDHCGACSCNCKKLSASKHWLWLHIVDRQGKAIRIAESGHLRDITEEVATMSGSLALAITGGCKP